jgi:hypothetical protein
MTIKSKVYVLDKHELFDGKIYRICSLLIQKKACRRMKYTALLVFFSCALKSPIKQNIYLFSLNNNHH